jgi:hypothetical protein
MLVNILHPTETFEDLGFNGIYKLLPRVKPFKKKFVQNCLVFLMGFFCISANKKASMKKLFLILFDIRFNVDVMVSGFESR